MNVYIIVGSTVTLFIAAIGIVLYRFYKRIGRRCTRKGCGRTDVKRVSKILLPPGEEILSLRNGDGKLRWFTRRPVKLTFTVCDCGWIELVKIDTDPISYWHRLWVKRFKGDQYLLDDQRLSDAARIKIRQLYLSSGSSISLDPQATDMPPLSLDSLFTAYFKTLAELLEK